MKTAKEYRDVMISVFEMKKVEAEDTLDKNDSSFDSYNCGYLNGYLSGMMEAKRVLEASEFLTD